MNQQVRRLALEFGPFGELIRAVLPIRAGDVVFELTGDVVNSRTKYTIQVDATRHLLTRNALWKSMNHSCVPNVRIDIDARQMIAISDIAPGQELTFNYNTTEWDMIAPFGCGCNTSACAETIRGFRYLTPMQRAAIPTDLLSPFITSRVNVDG